MSTTLALFGFARGPELIIIIGLIALLFFGKRLPELARSFGKGIVEFKKGLRGVKDELDEVDGEVASKKLDAPNVTQAAVEKPVTSAERVDQPA